MLTLDGVFLPHLDDPVVDGGVLLLPQHHQRDDDHGCYDDASHHQPDDGPLVGADVLCEEDLWAEMKGRRSAEVKKTEWRQQIKQ